MLYKLNSTFNNICTSFGSSKSGKVVAQNDLRKDTFIKTKASTIKPKSYYVAEILPKADISQKQLDEVFSDEQFSKKVLDNDWFCMWKDAMKLHKPLPTTGFCYPATEFFYHFVDCNTQPMIIKYDDKILDPKTGASRKQTHYFLSKENGIIYDPTKAQYKGEIPEYEKAMKFGFLTEFPSKKACAIAVKLGVISEDFAQKIPEIFRGKNYLHLSFEEKLALLKKELRKI